MRARICDITKFDSRRFLPYCIFLLLVLGFLWKPIFLGEALLPGDYLARMSPWISVVQPSKDAPQWNPLQWDAIAQFYPWRVFYARSMSDGHIPLWNPHQFSGMPFLANGQSAVLYPGTVLFLVFDPVTGFTVFAVLHLFLAAAFTYLLMRELGVKEVGSIIGGVVFTFSAFMVLWLELPTFISAAVWLPLTLFLIHRAVDRRSLFYAMLSGLTLALAFLAGHFQIAFYVAFAAMLWWLWKLVSVVKTEGKLYAIVRVVVPLAGFLFIVGLIAAPQVLPTQELAMNSHRVREATSEGYSRFIGNAVGPYRLVTAFVPDFFGNPSDGTYFLGSAADYMEYGLYVGILPLMLALIALGTIRRGRHTGFFAALGLIAVLTATGTPINLLFYYALPGFSALGGPNRILLLYVFSLAVLAGIGADYFGERASDSVRWVRRETAWGKLVALRVLVIVALAFLVANSLAVGYVERLMGQPFNGVLGPWGVTFVVFLLVSALLLIARAGSSITSAMFSWMAVALVASDLFAFGINYNPTCDRSKVYPDTALTKKLQSIAKDSRIAPINPNWSLYRTPEAILPPNAAMVYGLYDVQGYDSLYLRSYQELMERIQGVDPSPPENGNMVLVRRLTDDLNEAAEYVLSSEPVKTGVYQPVGCYGGVWIARASPRGDLPRPLRERVGVSGEYEPFTFRLGLFLMCVGVATLCCVGVYRVRRRRWRSRR